jgi:hypothetical protein
MANAQVVQAMTIRATKCSWIVFGRQSPRQRWSAGLSSPGQSPLRGVCVCLYFRDPIADQGLPSVWITAYTTQDHRGVRP